MEKEQRVEADQDSSPAYYLKTEVHIKAAVKAFRYGTLVDSTAAQEAVIAALDGTMQMGICPASQALWAKMLEELDVLKEGKH